MITWGEFVNLVEEKIAGVGEFFSSQSPADLGEDQKLTLSEPPMVPQEIPAVQQYDSAPTNLENFALTRLPVDQVYSSAEKIYPNKDGLMADIYGVPIKNPDGTYTDADGHTIMSSDVDGSPILPRDVPQYYEWYKTPVKKFDRNAPVDESITMFSNPSSNVAAAYMVSPDSSVYGESPVTEEEKAAGIHINEDGIKVYSDGTPLPEEIDKIYIRDKVATQDFYESGVASLSNFFKQYRDIPFDKISEKLDAYDFATSQIPLGPPPVMMAGVAFKIGVKGAKVGIKVGQYIARGAEMTDIAKESSKAIKVSAEKIVESANVANKGGETIAGHALQKHAGRNPEIWGKIKGGPEEINQTALKHLKEIMEAPGDFVKVTNERGIQFLEKKLSDGRGVRLNLDGTFKGFLDQ